MAGIPYGDPSSDAVFMGPVVSARQRDRVLGYIERGKEEGATLVTGGGRPAHLPKGWFVEPTLFVDVDNSMTIAQEEIFGPVLAVIPYEDDDDAVRIANDNKYGLSGGIFSASEERATALARRIRTGSMSVNGGLWYGADSPYGGYKASGIGRQCGLEGLEEYLETKAIAWPVRPGLSPARVVSGVTARRGLRRDHSPSSSSTVARRATKARLWRNMEAWCSGGVPMQPSVGMVTAKSSSAAPAAASGMARFVETPATTTSAIPMLRKMARISVRCTGEMPWCRGSTRSSGPTPISGTISMAGCDSSHAGSRRWPA